jgi:hypothetical protein
VRAFWHDGPRAATTTTLVVCGAVGVAGAALLVGHRAGLGAALVGAAVWSAAAPVLVRRRAVGDLVTVGLAIALVAVVAVRDAGWLVASCVVMALIAAASASTAARSVPAVLLGGVGWAAGAVRALPWAVRGVPVSSVRRPQVLTGLRSAAVTIALLVVFGALFASADGVFASYLPRLAVEDLPGQVAVGLLVALATATLAHLALAPPGWAGLRPRMPAASARAAWLLPVLALDALVGAFILVQVGALVGGHRYVDETSGLGYAEYARGGFGQLVAVTALTLVVVTVAARRAPRDTAPDRFVSSVALAVLCLATLGVVASALRRMDLYVEAFGMTRLRVFVVVVEIVLGAVLVLVLAAGVRWRGGWVPRAVVQVAAVAMLGLAIVDPDALIARHNTTVEPESGLDVAYLRGLSADAVPVLDGVEEPLRSCVLGAIEVHRPTSFVDWNLGRDRAADAMVAAAEVEADACAEVDAARWAR